MAQFFDGYMKAIKAHEKDLYVGIESSAVDGRCEILSTNPIRRVWGPGCNRLGDEFGLAFSYYITRLATVFGKTEREQVAIIVDMLNARAKTELTQDQKADKVQA